MSERTIEFTDKDKIGKVMYVDTNQIVIEIIGQDSISNINVGNIIIIDTSRNHEKIVALIQKVTRQFEEAVEIVDEEEELEEFQGFARSSDYVRVNIIGTFKRVEGQDRNVFKRGIESYPQIDSNCYILKGNNLQNFMGIIGGEISKEKQLNVGKFAMDVDADAILDGDKFFQRHAAILGSTGSGKSWCVANLLEKASFLKYNNIILFDMHGEYRSLCESENRIAEYYKIAGPGDLETENSNIIFLPYWLLNREEMLSMILDRSDYNAPNQASRFTQLVWELKKQTLEYNNKENIIKTFTVDSPIPYDINKLIEKLENDDREMVVNPTTNRPKKGEWNGKLTRFISRLKTKLNDKRYGFMFQPNETINKYNWLASMLCKLIGFEEKKKGIKIIDFSEVPSDVLPVVSGTLARLLFDIQFWMPEDGRTPFALICDEAHLYLPTKEEADSIQKQALYNFERIAKEGRKYGISIMAVSQRPSDVSKTILSQCNNFIVLRLTNDRDKSVIRNLLPDGLKEVFDQLPLLDIGEAIAVGDAILLPSRIQLSEPTCKPISATKLFWTDWDKEKPDNDLIAQAVEFLRGQTRIEN